MVRRRSAPAVVEIHGGPATLYGFSLMWEWQVLVARGISVFACNPRGSTGYGQDFCLAIWRDWGGPDFEDVMAAATAEERREVVDLTLTPDKLGCL